jgi:hypothetical protein
MTGLFLRGESIMIVQTSNRKFYRVFPITGATNEPDCSMAHMWHGFELRHVKKNIFYDKLTRRGNHCWTYVPKRGARVIIG